MMVMTAKLNMKKLVPILAAVVIGVLALLLLLTGGKKETSAPAVSGNEGRVAFLQGYGWEVDSAPRESGKVRIPKESGQVYSRYNELQKSQGYDLTEYAGKTVMRYVYTVNNLDGATGPVYATMLVYKNKVIGGDVTDTSAGGKMQGFKRTEKPAETTAPTEAAETTSPTEATAPTA